MKKLLLSTASFAAGVFCLAAAATPAAASVGAVILEGSDAIGYHCSGGNMGACAYMNQAWSALGGSDSRPIGVVGDFTFGSATVVAQSTSHGITLLANLGVAGALSQYAALYFTANNGCCSSDPANISGRQADMLAYRASGGTIQIGDYDGNSAWDFLVGTNGDGPNSSFAANIGCSDGETVTAEGLANGFTQPPALSCWTHQDYQKAHFAALGFTHDFYTSPRGGVYSSLLSSGKTITGGGGFGGGIPEPATWAMMLVGFGAMGGMLRSSRKRQALAA